MRASNLYLFLLLCSIHLYGQADSRVHLHFKVESDTTDISGINVLNLVTEKTAVTDRNGEFYMEVQAEDLLVLSAVHFEYKRRFIEKEDLDQKAIIIKMVSKVTQLDEVVVNQHPQITAEALGIVPKNQKIYTPAERKLYTATTGPLDILANLISGRTKMLKKELEISKKEILLEKMEFLLEDSYYINTLKIPQIHIKGFQYYIVDDAEFAAALRSKNKTLTMFLMSKLATQYLEIIKEER
ncbi:MAG TPA: hypothetical protein VF581_03280 [Flavobacterium sp.]|jgi:hypothetical protein